MWAPGGYGTRARSQGVILGLQSASRERFQGEKHTGTKNNTEEWGTATLLEDRRRNTLFVLRCRTNAFPGSCRLQQPELPGLCLHNLQVHPAAHSTGTARFDAEPVSTRAHGKAPLETQTKCPFAHTQQKVSLQQRLFTYRVFLRVADFHPEDVIQQPVNGFVLIEHQDELHDQAQIQRLEHFSCSTKKERRESSYGMKWSSTRGGKKKPGRLGCGGWLCPSPYVKEIARSSVSCTSTAGIANAVPDLIFTTELESISVS